MNFKFLLILRMFENGGLLSYLFVNGLASPGCTTLDTIPCQSQLSVDPTFQILKDFSEIYIKKLMFSDNAVNYYKYISQVNLILLPCCLMNLLTGRT